jgi:hypothetical protein
MSEAVMVVLARESFLLELDIGRLSACHENIKHHRTSLKSPHPLDDNIANPTIAHL